MMGEIARLERHAEDQDAGILRSISRSMRRRMKSNSTTSAPLSVATTSSWTPGFNPRRGERNDAGRRNVSSEGESNTVRKSRSMRDFVNPAVQTSDP